MKEMFELLCINVNLIGGISLNLNFDRNIYLIISFAYILPFSISSKAGVVYRIIFFWLLVDNIHTDSILNPLYFKGIIL